MIHASSPFTHKPISTSQVMQTVLLATLPGLATLTWFFGWGSLIQLVIASVTALVCEAAIMKLRKRPVSFYLKDASALVTAWLLALSLPGYAPWWLTVLGTAFAIIFAKQLYGGMGYNPFNPAMIGYALLLIALPVPMTQWAASANLTTPPSFAEGLHLIFQGSLALPDAITSATPLDVIRHKGSLTNEEVWQHNADLNSAWPTWIWLSLSWVLGGLYMLYRRVITWHIPVSLLAALLIISGLFYAGDTSNFSSPIFHLMAGATMFGAFFIATDPVTAATSNNGKLIYGAGIGILLYVIRTWGNYPDAMAFGVLLMNLAAPFLDYYTQPRTYGHKKARRGLPKKG
ncbi:electron transport complex subunit RsxD [Pokkaliibacter plantistimulans]|uniref:Ion-translocating oxidoreductase complex subunit D n=1 Tax=Proteobacteria bacterium 228 TaxID=2083153 RepID=A0A2S5KNJ9_9PROT|nr:electron transport complex subunit RsxD [Pokkaliibacter plantistimulans]PPC76292.1 electron transport complex subunit RsxD [Pokkaliibacter plantistimulans]